MIQLLAKGWIIFIYLYCYSFPMPDAYQGNEQEGTESNKQ